MTAVGRINGHCTFGLLNHHTAQVAGNRSGTSMVVGTLKRSEGAMAINSLNQHIKCGLVYLQQSCPVNIKKIIMKLLTDVLKTSKGLSQARNRVTSCLSCHNILNVEQLFFILMTQWLARCLVKLVTYVLSKALLHCQKALIAF